MSKGSIETIPARPQVSYAILYILTTSAALQNATQGILQKGRI